MKERKNEIKVQARIYANLNSTNLMSLFEL